MPAVRAFTEAEALCLLRIENSASIPTRVAAIHARRLIDEGASFVLLVWHAHSADRSLIAGVTKGADASCRARSSNSAALLKNSADTIGSLMALESRNSVV